MATKVKVLFVEIFLSLAFCILPHISIAQDSTPNLDSAIESLRADLRADKVAIITQAMQFNDQESKIFWPIYRKYDADVIKVNDQRVALIKTYADKFGTMTDTDAKTLIDQSLDFESRRTEIKKKYANEFQKAGLSSVTVAKFMQLEHRLDLLVDLQIASHLPALMNKPTSQSSSNQ